MTTERRARDRAAPRIALTGLEWRLYLIGALALAYVAVAWDLTTRLAVEVPADPSGEAPAPSAAPGEPGRAPRAAIWIDQLPVAARPAVALPPGWTIAVEPGAAAGAATPTAAPAVRRAAPARPAVRAVPRRRIRTRSS
ncbi:MAG: hypothetical protein H6708_19560 [Kofleriaceae bacterium]|nr:hypothetical protein [Kofleriaceae bacterium]